MTIVMTTCGSKKEAEHIAKVLVKEQLCACVNMWPVRSVYRWKKKIEKTEEWIMLCKTRNVLANRAARRIRVIHSYEMPVIEQWETMRASKGVEKWIQKSTR